MSGGFFNGEFREVSFPRASSAIRLAVASGYSVDRIQLLVPGFAFPPDALKLFWTLALLLLLVAIEQPSVM